MWPADQDGGHRHDAGPSNAGGTDRLPQNCCTFPFLLGCSLYDKDVSSTYWYQLQCMLSGSQIHHEEANEAEKKRLAKEEKAAKAAEKRRIAAEKKAVKKMSGSLLPYNDSIVTTLITSRSLATDVYCCSTFNNVHQYIAWHACILNCTCACVGTAG